jgi:hypothetical protein
MDGNASVTPTRLAISPGFRRWKRWQLAGLKTEVSMAKSITTADVTEAEASVAESQATGESTRAVKSHHVKRAERRLSRKASRPKKKQSGSAGTKQNLVLQMLRRQSGASIDDIVDKTGWQPHSVRGFLSGVVRRKLNLPLVPKVGKDGVRRYHLESLKAAKA